MAIVNCPKCDKQGECYCHEVGDHLNYEDEYVFVCKHCGHVVRETLSGGSSAGENWFTACPFCKSPSSEHLEPPEEFR